ncbi:MAG TPA: hypothetical protein VK760_05870 [Candidatus Acidoferrales bacterium]|nr:hypothetical protein [Candidatus Acidoferrales bacterium]
MSILATIHFVLAFLVLLCALVFSWNSRGRRVMNAVLGLQVLCGIVYAAPFVLQGALSPSIWAHVAGSLAALLAYGFARRLGDRPGGASTGLALSIVGLLCVSATIYLGFHMAGQI